MLMPLSPYFRRHAATPLSPDADAADDDASPDAIFTTPLRHAAIAAAAMSL